MKKQAWVLLSLLLVGSLVYVYRDFQSAHPVWLNWLFTGMVLTGFITLVNKYQNVLRPVVFGCIGCITLVSISLPLIGNVSDVAFRRDVQRVKPGMSRVALLQHMKPYRQFQNPSSSGREICEFREAIHHDGYYWQAVFTLREGKVLDTIISTHEITSSEHYWVYPNHRTKMPQYWSGRSEYWAEKQRGSVAGTP
jgi:hypothetical protein